MMMITLVSYFDSDKSNFCKSSPVEGTKINSNPKNIHSILIFCSLYETTINKTQKDIYKLHSSDSTQQCFYFVLFHRDIY